MSDIEVDFQLVADQINAKIKEASEALKEANKLACSIGVKYYDDTASNSFSNSEQAEKEKQLADLVDFDPVLSALDNAGWQTSSMTANC